MNTKTTPKDFFLHLAATIALYTAVIALINLVFSVINYARPDALAGYFSPSSIAWPISVLIVLIPTVYVIEWLLVRDMRRMPEKKDLWIRRWRIYLTLFLSGATILGDLIALVNTYLSGEITSRFVWKVLAILVICGVVFAYYLLARMLDEARGRAARKSLATAGIVLVVAAIVGGFLIVGSPSRQRDLRFDTQRVSDLSSIQWQVIGQWQRIGSIPVSLDDLKDPISGSIIPRDPETGKPYEYKATGPKSFELCATFGQESQDLKGHSPYAGGYGGGMGGGIFYGGGRDIAYPPMDESWIHKAGHACFARTIDPTRYPVNPKQI